MHLCSACEELGTVTSPGDTTHTQGIPDIPRFPQEGPDTPRILKFPIGDADNSPPLVRIPPGLMGIPSTPRVP